MTTAVEATNTTAPPSNSSMTLLGLDEAAVNTLIDDAGTGDGGGNATIEVYADSTAYELGVVHH